MIRINIDILGISKLKRMGVGKFNSDDHHIYYCGQESLRRNGMAFIVNKSLKCSTWVRSQNWQNDLSSLPWQTIQHHRNSSPCPKHKGQRSWSWLVLWRPKQPSESNTQKRCPFQSRKSRDTWTNRQVWLWSTNEAGQRFTEFCQEKALVLANTLFQQHKTCFLGVGKGKKMDFPLQPPEKNAGLLAL